MNLVLADTIRMPAGFANLRAFRRWTRSADYPQRGEFSYLAGDLWVDLSMETLLHNQLKSILAIVLGGMVVNDRLGVWFADRMRLVNVAAGLSVEPDGMFAAQQSIRSGQVSWVNGHESLELLGTPDMVLEVVSKTSIQKDTVVLRELYAAAGIPEYWLVQAAGDGVTLDILRLTARGYSASRKSDGWTKSAVFGKSFRLVQEDLQGDLPEYRLQVR